MHASSERPSKLSPVVVQYQFVWFLKNSTVIILHILAVLNSHSEMGSKNPLVKPVIYTVCSGTIESYLRWYPKEKKLLSLSSAQSFPQSRSLQFYVFSTAVSSFILSHTKFCGPDSLFSDLGTISQYSRVSLVLTSSPLPLSIFRPSA